MNNENSDKNQDEYNNENDYNTNLNYEPVNTIEFHPGDDAENENLENNTDNNYNNNNNYNNYLGNNSNNATNSNTIILPKVLKNNILNTNKHIKHRSNSKDQEIIERLENRNQNTSGSIKSIDNE